MRRERRTSYKKLERKVAEAMPLGLFLEEQMFPEKSRTTIKQLLRDRLIAVNGQATTQYTLALEMGDVVSYFSHPLPKELKHPLVEILWQDEYLLVVRKEAGIPTVASGEEKDLTVLRLLSDHLKKFDPRAKVFHLNRIDKDSSGLLLFTKDRALQQLVTERWSEYVLDQEFLAVTEGILLEPKGLLQPIEPKDGAGSRDNSAPPQQIRPGLASYEERLRAKERAMYRVRLEQGRNSQMRKQFTLLGHPLVGDWRNGSPSKKVGFVALRLSYLHFIHPVEKTEHKFHLEMPPIFRRLVKQQTIEPKTMTNRRSGNRR